jgi:hypothetical protein
MKKLIIITSLLVITASCLNEEFETVKVQAPSLYCSTENDFMTKTSLSVNAEGIGTIYWKPADCINVFFGTKQLKYSSTNKENATNVIFDAKGELDGSQADFSNIWGLYPYNASATSDGVSVRTTIPSSQKCIKNTFDTDLFPMLAHSSSNELHFNNICGGIKFSLSRNDIKTITFKGNNNENIAGKVKVVMDENGKPKASIESGEKIITLKPKEGATFSSGSYYYIVILPCSLTKGFTMTFETDEEIGTLNYKNKTITIKRSVFGKKENIDSYASFKVIIPDGVVDMGLSVMWATCNLGAATPDKYGDYYAWGETKTKTDYTWSNYKWGKNDSSLTKYNKTDGKTTLDLEDDVAYVKLGGRWRMPTSPEIDELRSNCTIKRTTYNGVTGYQYTSKKNGNTFFVPTGGKRYNGYLNYEGNSYLWSSYKGLYITSTVSSCSTGEIYRGLPVRPVFHADQEYEKPENPSDGIVDLGLSVKWRSCNLGAKTPEETGCFYQWAGTSDVSNSSLSDHSFPYGRKSGSTYYLSKYNTGDHNGTEDKKRQLEAVDDAATVILGGAWRTPTYVETRELIDNCTWTRICINGVGGYKAQSKVKGFTDKWIFLPATGSRTSGKILEEVSETGGYSICKYWSSSLGSDSLDACVFPSISPFTYAVTDCRYYGLPIRPVTDQ